MTGQPGIDVYLSYDQRDREVVGELEQHLLKAGLRVWLGETAVESGEDWQAALASALAGARFVLVCIGPTGIGRGQVRELEVIEARAASHPDFPLAAALLPGVAEDFPPSALPVQLAKREWLDLRRGVSEIGTLVSLLAAPSPPQAEAGPPTTPSVDNAAARLTGEVTAAAFVSALLTLHPEYGERRGGVIELETEKGELAAAGAWLERVRALLEATAVKEIHGRLMIVALARLDSDLREQLEHGGFLAAVEREIREPLSTLFRDQPPPPEETVPTLTDNPAIADELNREGYARILARRIRDVRERETSPAKAVGAKAKRPAGGSFLVHVHGPWGIGKTSLLNFLRNELHKPEPNPWVVITFNAWQHQRLAPPWWWLMTSLYRQGGRELWHMSWWRGVWFRLREWLWRLRGGWQGLVMLVAGAVAFVMIWRAGFFRSLSQGDLGSLETLKGVIVGIAAVLAPILTIWGAARSAGRWILTTSARGARLYIDHARDPMQTMKDHFGQLVSWLGYPLAILVDDLDRCKPQYVVEFLEGVQTLFRDVPVTYVVAADREWLAASYATEYQSFLGVFDEPGRPIGYLFVEKTFQVTLPVPAMNEETRDGYWRRLIRPVPLEDPTGLESARAAASAFFATFETEEDIRAELARNPGLTPVEQRARLEAAAIQLCTPKLEQASEHVLQPFRPLLDANPRAMKRLVNAYGLARGIELLSRHSLGGDKQAQHRTALWTILSLRWPRLAEYLADHPDSASAFKQGSPPGAPAEFLPLFADPLVRRVVLGDAQGVNAALDPDSIRLCVSA